MALHFTSERPEDQFYTDFGNFNKFEGEVGTVAFLGGVRRGREPLAVDLHELILVSSTMSMHDTAVFSAMQERV